jgi:hypothetical protein
MSELAPQTVFMRPPAVAASRKSCYIKSSAKMFAGARNMFMKHIHGKCSSYIEHFLGGSYA